MIQWEGHKSTEEKLKDFESSGITNYVMLVEGIFCSDAQVQVIIMLS